MGQEKEEAVLERYLKDKNLKHSQQRKEILGVFLKTDKHLTAEELYSLVRARYSGIGYATVYRSLKLFCQAGLCRELKFDDGTSRYEHLYNHEHHDHLICTKCGKFVEIIEPAIEKLQEKIFKSCGFYPERHRMELYGVCKKCTK